MIKLVKTHFPFQPRYVSLFKAFCFQDNFVSIINELKRPVTWRDPKAIAACVRQPIIIDKTGTPVRSRGRSWRLVWARAQYYKWPAHNLQLYNKHRPGLKSGPTTNPTLGSIFAAPGPETGATDIIPSEYKVELATKVIRRLPNISQSRKRPLLRPSLDKRAY